MRASEPLSCGFRGCKRLLLSSKFDTTIVDDDNNQPSQKVCGGIVIISLSIGRSGPNCPLWKSLIADVECKVR
jgi:hypothetical protein